MRKALDDQKAPDVHSWVLDLSTGLIKDLEISTQQWQLPRSCLIASTPVIPLHHFHPMAVFAAPVAVEVLEAG